LPIVGEAFIFYNSEGKHEFLAQKQTNKNLNIVNTEKLNQLKFTMTSFEKHEELKNKIMRGLELTDERLLEFKKQKSSPLVVLRENKIVKIKP
jgi:hypothetical protein